MGNEQYCGTTAEYLPHALDALLLKGRIAHAENFIDDQYIWIHMRSDRESEPGEHPGGVAFHRSVNKIFDSGKGDDLVELRLDLSLGHTQNGAIQKDILASG